MWETYNVISDIALSLIRCFNNPNVSVDNRARRRQNHVHLAVSDVSHGRAKYVRINYILC